MTDQELMQQALEALTAYDGTNGASQRKRVLAALRERLALPQMQPCAGRNCGSTNSNLHSAECFEDYEKSTGMAQPEQEPVAWMTINEYGEEDDIHYENPEGHLMEGWTYKPLYTHPPTVQPEKEPLEYWNAVEGWVKIDEVREHFGSVGCGTIYKTAGEDRVPVYTNPPKRQWVGLTAQEAADCWTTSATQTWHNFEAALRSKNT